MKERPIHPTIPKGDEEEDSRGKGTKRKRQKQTTFSNFIRQRIGTDTVPKRLRG